MRLCCTFALICAASIGWADPPRLELVHQQRLEFPRASDFGGLSGLVIENDGETAQVLNDRGILFELVLKRKPDGSIKWVSLFGQRFLYTRGEDVGTDSEGLAAWDGGYYVSYEDPMRVDLFIDTKLWPDAMIAFPQPADPPINRGLEALAIDTEGRLITLPEAVPDGRTDFPISRWQDGVWHEIATLPKQGSFLVTGADMGPDGRLYVLERAVSLLGFRTRIRRVDLSDPSAQAEVLLESHVSQFDNHEGISVWRDGHGTTRITLISDDNFLSVQQTELLEFVLHE